MRTPLKKTQQAKLFNNLGCALRNVKRYKKAKGYFTKSLKVGPHNKGLVLLNLGTLSAQMKDMKSAYQYVIWSKAAMQKEITQLNDKQSKKPN